jgi:hypothetical protein
MTQQKIGHFIRLAEPAVQADESRDRKRSPRQQLPSHTRFADQKTQVPFTD